MDHQVEIVALHVCAAFIAAQNTVIALPSVIATAFTHLLLKRLEELASIDMGVDEYEHILDLIDSLTPKENDHHGC